MTTCLIDGRPVPLIDWQAQVDADWGERSLTGRLPRFTPWAEQEAPIELWTPTGELLWSGTLAQDPRHDGDTWAIRALGPAEALAENRTRLFYRIDGAEGWGDIEGDPHGYNGNEKFDLFQSKATLRITWGDTVEAFAVGNEAGFVLWVEGGLITRYSVIGKGVANSQMDLRIRRATGPSGAATLIADHAAHTADDDEFYEGDITDPEDMLMFVIRTTTAHTPGGRRRFHIRAIKVYGRTTNDAFSASDAARDVAGLTGFAAEHVESNGLAVLPLDWTEGHPEFLTYLSGLTDWRWMARGDGLHFGPWSRTWQAHTSRDARAELEPEPRYNRFRVTYEALSGVHREVVATPEVDPFPGHEVVSPDEVDLANPQPDSALAKAVAAAGVEYVAARNVNGPVELVRVRDDKGGVHSPYAACAGDLLSMPNLAPDIGPQRIRSITYRPSHQATAELGDTFSPMHTIATFRREKKKRRRRRRRAA